MPDDFFQRRSISPDGEIVYCITNYLFHVPLYAFYIFTIIRYLEEEVEGTLMTSPIEIYGPFASPDAAQTALDKGLTEIMPD